MTLDDLSVLKNIIEIQSSKQTDPVNNYVDYISVHIYFTSLLFIAIMDEERRATCNINNTISSKVFFKGYIGNLYLCKQLLYMLL